MRQLAEVLGGVALFADLPSTLREQIADAAELRRLAAGAWLFHQGDAGDAFFVVVSGRLEVVNEAAAEPAVLGLIPSGGALGELSLLTGEPRSAGVRAVRDCELAVLGRRSFHDLLATQPDFARALTAALGRRLQANTRPVSKQPPHARVVTVVALDDGVPLPAFTAILVAALADGGSAAAMERSTVPADGSGSLAAAAGPVLDRYEDDNDFVLLLVEARAVSDPADEWAAFCLRQADRVLAVTSGGSVPPPAPAVPAVRGSDHVALGGPVDRAIAWEGWLAATRRFRVAGETDQPRFRDDVARLARRLAGRATGLVLSGGGARGFAHIGVLGALAEAGVTIDRFGGTSMGAFVSALAAGSRTAAEIHQVCRDKLADGRAFSDYTVPRHALITGRRAEAMLREVFDDQHIEGMTNDWFAVSADLLTADVVAHRSGLVREALLASMALPGMAPPRRSGSRLLVDGGVLNNLPVDVMAATGEGPVLAVDVVRRWGSRWADPSPPAGRRRRRRGEAGTDALPPIMETLAASTTLGSSRAAEHSRSLATLVISPDVADVRLLGFGDIDRIVEQGRRAAIEALDNWHL